MYTVSNVFNTALRPFSGTSVNSFVDPNGIVADAVRTVANEVDLVESKRLLPLLPALYAGNQLYVRPSDTSTILDIKPAGGRSLDSYADFTRTDPMTMSKDINNYGTNFTTEYINGVALMRIQPGGITDTRIVLNDTNSLTANGTITATGDATNLDINTVFFLNGNASLDFDIVPNTNVSNITIDGMDAVDISSITRDGSFSFGMSIPEELEGKITSVEMRVGSDSSNYYKVSTAVNAYGGSLIVGFNPLRYERRLATETGTVVDAVITYIQIKITHTNTSTAVGVKIDAISVAKGIGYVISYYSNYNFIDATTGAFKKEPNDVGLIDLVNVEDNAFELVVDEAKKIMDMELRGEGGGAIYKLAERRLRGIWGDFSNPGGYEKYRLRFPSERKSIVTQYENHPYE